MTSIILHNGRVIRIIVINILKHGIVHAPRRERHIRVFAGPQPVLVRAVATTADNIVSKGAGLSSDMTDTEQAPERRGYSR